MNTLPVIVNHKSDPKKQNGLLLSTFTYLGQYVDEKEQPQMALQVIHQVVWPELPVPLSHQEANDDLEFVSVYDANSDDAGRSEEDEANEALVNLLIERNPDLHDELVDILNAQSDEDEVEETEEDDAPQVSMTTEVVDDAHAPNN